MTKTFSKTIFCLGLFSLFSLMSTSAALGETEGEEIGREAFKQTCIACHGSQPVPRALKKEQLAELTPEHIYRVITEGLMAMQSAGLNEIQRRAVAIYLSKKPWGSEPKIPEIERLSLCTTQPPISEDALDRPSWNGWGLDLDNTHFQTDEHARLDANDIKSLELRWAFGFPGATTIGAQPTVTENHLFVGSPTKGLYSLNPRTGCTYWKADLEGPVRAAPILEKRDGRWVLYVGDRKGFVYQLDAHTGEILWKFLSEDHPDVLITSSPVLHKGRLYLALASLEELSGGNMNYECCTFRGSVQAIDVATGTVDWKTYVIPEEPKPTKKTRRGVQLYAPSGAGIWSSPTIDEKRGVLYVTTGDNYSSPASDTSDSVIAIELDGGKIRWVKQTVAGDAFTSACANTVDSDPERIEDCGPDLDFGAAAVLRTLPDGKQLLYAGQKNGVMYALDPDNNGEIVWQKKLSPGGILGGIEWGFAADEEHLYVPISDVWENSSNPGAAGGIFAIRIDNGKTLWHTAAPALDSCLDRAGCNAGQPGQATLTKDAVFSGSMDGHIRAYNPQTGEIIWDYDSNRDFETVNGVPASGGSVNGPGVTVVDGWVYVSTGYGLFGMPGNGFLAFGPPKP